MSHYTISFTTGINGRRPFRWSLIKPSQAALQAATILVAMVSQKKYLATEILATN